MVCIRFERSLQEFMVAVYGTHFKWEVSHRPTCVLALLDAINMCYKTNPSARSTLREAVIAECTLENGAYTPR